MQLAGVVAAVVLAVVVNVLAARHFTRWDWTGDKRWSLSPATLETLHTLEQRSTSGPSRARAIRSSRACSSCSPAYQAASSARRRALDRSGPRRRSARSICSALRPRGGARRGRARGDRRHRHRRERRQALVSDAAGHVRADRRRAREAARGARAHAGHPQRARRGEGEALLHRGTRRADARAGQRRARGPRGAARSAREEQLRARRPSTPRRRTRTSPSPAAAVVVIAGPRAPFAPDEANRLRTWLLEGGSLLRGRRARRCSSAGRGMVGGGARRRPRAVRDRARRRPRARPRPDAPPSRRRTARASSSPPARTRSRRASWSAAADAHPPRVAVFFARSLRHVVAARRRAGRRPARHERRARTRRRASPAPRHGSRRRRASRRIRQGRSSSRWRASGRASGRSAPHGPRVVVVGSRFILAEDNWRQPRAAARGSLPRRQRALLARGAARRSSTCRTGRRSRPACACRDEGRAEVRALRAAASCRWRRCSSAPRSGRGAHRGEQALRAARARRAARSPPREARGRSRRPSPSSRWPRARPRLRVPRRPRHGLRRGPRGRASATCSRASGSTRSRASSCRTGETLVLERDADRAQARRPGR